MTLKSKIDFVLFVSVTNANPNGDPLNGNRPRVNYGGFGEISDVCIKRKIRNRMQDLDHRIFVQSDDRCDDGFKSLSERAAANIKAGNSEEYARIACEKWLDVRSFGQVFAFKSDKSGVSVACVASVAASAMSCSPVDIESIQTTRASTASRGKAPSDTMGAYGDLRSVQDKRRDKRQWPKRQTPRKTPRQSRNACALFVNDASLAPPTARWSCLYW